MKVRYGIIGLGTIANKFADAVSRIDSAELICVAARDQSRADAFAGKYRVKKAFGSYSRLIEDKDVDIIYIGVTHNFHYDLVKECLNKGKAVLCEKPLVLTRKEAEELAELSQKSGILLMEAMWTRCMPAYRKAQEWVRAGRIGEVKHIFANFCFKGTYDPQNRWYNPKLAGGSLFDVGIYPIEFCTGILAEDPAEITGVAKIAPSGVDEAASVSMRFPGGALAGFSCGFTANVMDEAVICGTEGKIVLENCFGPLKAELFNAQKRRIEKFEKRVPNGFIYEAEHCAGLFQAGKLQSDLIPLADTIACAGVFDTLRRQWGLI